jgi:hypothetical protein
VSLAYPPTPLPDPYRLRETHPWHPLSALWLTAATGLALILILVGYVMSSGTLRITWQLAGVNIGLGALVLQAVGAIAWITRGYRALRQRQRELVYEIAMVYAGQPAVPTAPTRTEPRLDDPASFSSRIVVHQGTVHHLPTCPLAVDKPVALSGDAARDGRIPCRVCQP